MVFRVRVRVGPRGGGSLRRQLASKAAVFLTPAALVALILATWRLGADLGWAGEFAIPDGLFSHWQVWMALAAVVQVCASALNRYGTPKPLKPIRGAAPPKRPKPPDPPTYPVAKTVPDGPRHYPVADPPRRSTYPVKDRTYF